MRIAVFTTDLYQGGVAESTRKIVNLLAETHSVDLIVYDTPPITLKVNASVKIYKISAPLSVNFAGSNTSRSIKRYTRIFGFVYALLYILTYKAIRQPTHTYSLTYIPNLLNVITGLFFKNQKTIISERQDPRMDLRNSPTIARILKRFYPLSNRVHVNSGGMGQAVEEFYGLRSEKICRIDNFFDLDEIRRLSAAPLPPEVDHIFTKPVIITSGRLSQQKGHWHLLAAFSKVKKLLPEVELVFLGDGELKASLQKLSSDLDLKSCVHFFGNTHNPHRFVAKSAVFVFPSIWESFGNSLLEAMAIGIPVISSSCMSGPGEIIGFGSYGIDVGTLPAYEDLDKVATEMAAERIADAIIFILSDKSAQGRFSLLAREGAEKFDVAQARPSFRALIEST